MELPRYPVSAALELGHRPYLQEIFHRLQSRMSELTFANLYLFRKAHCYRLALAADSVVIIGKGYGGGEEYFLPPLSGNPAVTTDLLLGEGLTLYCHEDFLNMNPEVGRRHQVLEDRDSFDYLYLRSDLAELPGNRYHKKKNRISYFEKRYRHTVQRYSAAYRAGCLQLLDEWLRVHGRGVESLKMEAEATREGIELAEMLGLQGVVVLVDDVIRGFALGELLNSDTSVCHFEKGDPFLEGVYQLVNREYNRLVFPHCTYANREQDLGEANLRETKLSYHPAAFIKKYQVKGGSAEKERAEV